MERDRRPRPPEPTADDERAASARRRALRSRGIVPIESDPRVAVLLEPGERVVAQRRCVEVEDGGGGSSAAPGPHDPVDLYVTDRRLLGIGMGLDVPLDAIIEADIAGGRLRLQLGDTRGIAIGVSDPAVLRVELAAALRARRRGR
jgi:hypothetical protein